MTNSYFNRSFDVLPGNRVGSQTLEDQIELVEQGFDKLPSPLAVWAGSANYAVDTGSANALAIAVSANVTSLADGTTFLVKAVAANTGATVVTVTNAVPTVLGSPSIVRPDNTALSANDILAGQIIQISYSTAMGKFQLALTGASAGASATAAAASAAAASDSAAAAASSYDSFDDRYLGAKASDPALDNDGNAILTGALYFNTAISKMKAYTGTAWEVPDTGAYLQLVGGTMAGALNLATGTNIASASTVNLDTATGNRVHITGTTTITSVTLTRGPRTVIFDGALTLTHHATNNNLPGAANITTEAGDRAIYESDGATVYCVGYFRKDGAAVVSSGGSWVYQSTVVAAGASTMDFEPFGSTYPMYAIVIPNLRQSASSGSLEARFKLSGSYVATNTYYSHNMTPSSGANTYLGYGRSAQSSMLLNGAGFDPTDAENSMSLTIFVSNPSSTTFAKSIFWQGIVNVSGPNSATVRNLSGAGGNSGTGANTGLRLGAFSSGGTLTGEGYIYGIKNS